MIINTSDTSFGIAIGYAVAFVLIIIGIGLLLPPETFSSSSSHSLSSQYDPLGYLEKWRKRHGK
jgi:hypothetical protein